MIDPETKVIYGLSCAHNFCRYNSASKDKTPEEMVELLPAGTRVLQPALIDRKFKIYQFEEHIKRLEAKLRGLRERLLEQQGVTETQGMRRME